MASSRRVHGRRGFTLLELTLAATVFALGAGAAVYAFLGSHYLSRSSTEAGAALQAAQNALERVRAADFPEAFARFNATTADDPPAGLSPGSAFAVPELNAQVGDPDGLVGAITFPGDGIQLREDDGDRDLGMPRDLNLDGAVDALDHSADYAVLPVRVTVAWRGVLGNRQVSVVTTLVEK